MPKRVETVPKTSSRLDRVLDWLALALLLLTGLSTLAALLGRVRALYPIVVAAALMVVSAIAGHRWKLQKIAEDLRQLESDPDGLSARIRASNDVYWLEDLVKALDQSESVAERALAEERLVDLRNARWLRAWKRRLQWTWYRKEWMQLSRSRFLTLDEAPRTRPPACPHCHGPVRLSETQEGATFRCAGRCQRLLHRETWSVGSANPEPRVETAEYRVDAQPAESSSITLDRNADVPTLEPADGGRFGRFQIHERIETDGFCSVHRASDDAGGTINLQMIRYPHLLDGFDERRFSKDAERLASLRHARLVTVRGFGVENAIPWMAFDPWPPQTLAELLHRVRLEPSSATSIVADVSSALDAVHAAGLVHGKLKPGLVRVADDGTAFVSGLDLEWILSLWERQDSQPRQVGNISYYSPEEINGKHPVTPRTDIYRLGLLAFECLTGQRPFEYDGLVAHAMRKLELQITIPRDASLGREALDVLRRSLALDPEARWPTAAAFSEALIAAYEQEGEAR
jgi:hypothetical protein